MPIRSPAANGIPLPYSGTLLSDLDENIGGHVNVIKGAEWDEEQGKYMYTIFDPDPINTGGQHKLSYEELLIGKKDIQGGCEYSLWFPTVVVRTSYSEKTFLEEIFSVQ